MNTEHGSVLLALKQGLDVKNRPGSGGGCPHVNLSSLWHTVELRLASADLHPAGNDRQALGLTAAASCLDVVVAQRGRKRRSGGKGLRLRLCREKETQANKAPFTVHSSDGEL